MVARQQRVAEAAERVELGGGLCWVLEDLQDVALQRQDKDPPSLNQVMPPVRKERLALDKVKAVPRKA